MLPFEYLQGALGLVTRLTTVLQPRDPDVRDGKGKGNVSTLKEGGSDGGLRDAVVAAAKHLSGEPLDHAAAD